MNPEHIHLPRDEAERVLASLRRIVVDARELMDGGSLRAPSSIGYDIHRTARSLHLYLEPLVHAARLPEDSPPKEER
jgi:hypothetical protein